MRSLLYSRHIACYIVVCSRLPGRSLCIGSQVHMLSINWKGYRIIAWACQALLVAAIIVTLVQRQWWPAGALTGFLVISYLFVAFERRLPPLFDLVFMIAALINASGWAWDLYNKPGPV